jgi:hypothetical protein
MNSPTWKSDTDCVAGGCLSFDGVNDYVNVPDSNSLDLGTNDYSFSFFIKGNYDSNPNYRRVISKGGYPCLEIYFTDTSIGFQIGNCTARDSYGVSKSGILNESFNLYTAVKTSTYVYLYTNGSLVVSAPLLNNYNVSNNLSLRVGGNGLTEFFLGNLDDIRIYNRALSAAEVSAIYNATK